MDTKTFNAIAKRQLDYCADLLCRKGKEYAIDDELDRLVSFKTAAQLMHTDPKRALMGMLSKHITSLYDMTEHPTMDFTEDKWVEKLTDSINYMVLLRAVLEEEFEKALCSRSYKKPQGRAKENE